MTLPESAPVCGDQMVQQNSKIGLTKVVCNLALTGIVDSNSSYAEGRPSLNLPLNNLRNLYVLIMTNATTPRYFAQFTFLDVTITYSVCKINKIVICRFWHLSGLNSSPFAIFSPKSLNYPGLVAVVHNLPECQQLRKAKHHQHTVIFLMLLNLVNY